MAGARDGRTTGGLRLFGIEIRVRVSWAIIALIVAWSLATGAFPEVYKGLPASSYWSMALLVVAGLAVSIVLHEMAHSLVARAFGLSVDRITLFLFGGVAELHEEPKTPRAELLMALAGPALSLVLGFVFAVAAGAVEQGGGGREVSGALSYLATLNFVLAVFNMTPAFPMDGGRVLRAIIWKVTRDSDRATRIAAGAGEGFALFLIGAGLFLSLVGHVASGLWWILIGFFLRTAARSSVFDLQARKALRGYLVRDVMDAGLEPLSGDMSLAAFAARRLYAAQHGMYPVVVDGAVVGVVEAAEILKVPEARWASATLAEVCTPLDKAAIVRANEDAHTALERMTREGRARLFVAELDRLVGVVALRDLLERLELSERFNKVAGDRRAA